MVLDLYAFYTVEKCEYIAHCLLNEDTIYTKRKKATNFR